MEWCRIWLKMQDELEALIERARNGEKAAFGEIYKFFLSRIFRFVYFSVHDHDLAWDLTQNTFLKAWKSLRLFSPKRGSFQAFLFTIARHLIIDWWRKRKEISLAVIGEPLIEDDLETEIFRKEEKLLVQTALTKLDPFEKEIVVLRYFEDLTFFEIGEIIGKKEGTVRVKIHRALQKLKKHLKGQYEH